MWETTVDNLVAAAAGGGGRCCCVRVCQDVVFSTTKQTKFLWKKREATQGREEFRIHDASLHKQNSNEEGRSFVRAFVCVWSTRKGSLECRLDNVYHRTLCDDGEDYTLAGSFS